MHVPIIYVTSSQDEIYDLSQSEEKEKFLNENFPEKLTNIFNNYIPITDYWDLNVQEGSASHESASDIEELLRSIVEVTAGESEQVKKQGSNLSMTIDDDIAHAYYKQQIKDITLAAEYLQTTNIENLDELSKNVQMFKFLVKDDEYTQIQFIDTNVESPRYGVPMSIFSFLTSSIIEKKAIEYTIYTQIHGDYHY